MADILDIELEGNDAGAYTVGGYLFELLSSVLHQEESFSGKRPFGNSGWLDHDLLLPIREATGWDDMENEDLLGAILDGVFERLG